MYSGLRLSVFSSGYRIWMALCTIESIHQCLCFVQWHWGGKSLRVSNRPVSLGPSSFQTDRWVVHISASLYTNQSWKSSRRNLISYRPLRRVFSVCFRGFGRIVTLFLLILLCYLQKCCGFKTNFIQRTRFIMSVVIFAFSSLKH